MLAGPRGIPAAIVGRLEIAVRTIMQRPELQSRWDDLGVVPEPTGAVAAQKLVAAEVTRWLKVLRDAGVQPQQ